MSPSNSLPRVKHFNLVNDLSRLTFHQSPRALVALREAFAQAGDDRGARALTYAVNRGLRQRAEPVESALSFVFFELTCLYGFAPARPLWLLLAWTIAMALPYAIGLKFESAEFARPWGLLLSWLRLAKDGLMVSVVVLCPPNGREGYVRRKPSRFDTLQAKRWARGAMGLQRLVSVYLLLLWGLITYWHPFLN